MSEKYKLRPIKELQIADGWVLIESQSAVPHVGRRHEDGFIQDRSGFFIQRPRGWYPLPQILTDQQQ